MILVGKSQKKLLGGLVGESQKLWTLGGNTRKIILRTWSENHKKNDISRKITKKN